MKLWEIKAQSLRIMFSDTDMNFDETEFSEHIVYDNPNTRDKLIRMEDSIRRGINLYYSIVGEFTKTNEFNLMTAVVGENTILLNKVDCSSDPLFGFPSRVDARAYDSDGLLKREFEQINFSYDPINKHIFFYGENYATFSTNNDVTIVFTVWYKTKKLNVPIDSAEMTYDLDSIYIPEEVQQMIPLYVKSELYEEDEPNLAKQARNDYLSFLYGLRKPFSNVQTKVKRAKVFDK